MNVMLGKDVLFLNMLIVIIMLIIGIIIVIFHIKHVSRLQCILLFSSLSFIV